jgi:putative nucleotidyltransferase with HDIG domain
MDRPKTRILFVDDEPIILELLKLSVSSMSDEWETAYAKSAEEALALMGPSRPEGGEPQRPPGREIEAFDIVISDMQLPGISGAQLLNDIMRRFPGTIRIILSGHGDQELVMRCVGATHQFLLKPFKLADLKAVLKRIHGLKERLHSEEIKRLVGREESLPSIPDVYFKVLDALQDPNCPLDRIGGIVAGDPALTVKLLQLVNSAFLGIAREVSSADEAVMILGTGAIRSLVLGLRLFSAFNALDARNDAMQKVWGHSVRVGRLAQRIGEIEGGDEKLMEEAFTAGLLHDVGKLILAENPSANYLQFLDAVDGEKRSLISAEREAFQATHAEVGAYLLDLWGLPLQLVEAVALHHEPTRAGATGFSALTAVHAANALEHQAAHAEASATELDGAYLEQLNLSDRIPVWRRELETL